jgi:actin-like ATPase involved in cell morphogenesis
MSQATIGIDFSTTFSSMAWFNPKTGQAEVLKNAEGEEKTPSVVYFGERATLVGTPAEQMLEDEQERRRVVVSVKRELVHAPTLALPGRRVKALEVAAEVLKKLKRDAEELHFHEAVSRAVVTCPAAFDYLEREEIERAARRAGFEEVRLLEEPVAAALAYSREGLKVGRYVLVYDLGGGTFDLALLREAGGGFELALEPKGLRRCGGDDFDEALYDYCEEEAQRQWGQALNGEGRDLRFLRECRKRKESLSAHDQVLFSSLVGEGRVFKHTLTREVFEELIGGRVETTVRLTGELVRTAKGQDYRVETVVLIGGSSRIPLVQRKLQEALPVEARKWRHQDVAVALGAAYFAQELWAPQPVSGPRPEDLGKREQYRAAVEMAWTDKSLNRAEVERLLALATALGLSREQAADIERQVMGDFKEAILDRQPTPRSAAKATVTVTPDGTGDYASLDQAVAAIAENGTIRLWPGEHHIKAPLTIEKPDTAGRDGHGRNGYPRQRGGVRHCVCRSRPVCGRGHYIPPRGDNARGCGGGGLGRSEFRPVPFHGRGVNRRRGTLRQWPGAICQSHGSHHKVLGGEKHKMRSLDGRAGAAHAGGERLRGKWGGDSLCRQCGRIGAQEPLCRQ